MKKFYLLFALILFFFAGCKSMKVKPEVNLIKAHEAQLAKLEGENSILRIQSKELEAKLNAQAQAIAGFNNKVQNLSAGRDNIANSGNTNDSDLMKYIFEYWYLFLIAFLGAIGSLFVGVWGIVKFVMTMNERLLKTKDLWIENLMKANEKKERDLDIWQNRMIEESINRRG